MKLFISNASKKLQLLLHITCWIALLTVNAVVFIRVYPLELAFLRAFGNVIPMAFFFYLNFYLIQQLAFKSKVFIYGVLTIMFFFFVNWVRVEFNLRFPEIDNFHIKLNSRDRWMFGAALTNFSAWIISAIYAIFYHRLEVDRYQKEIINQQNEAQLKFLRAQINPHFLFNTLNNIYSLAIIKSDKTADMVLKLSNLLRYVIYEGREEKVQLRNEAKQIQEYIELFQMKSEYPLNIQYSVKGVEENLLFEPMILIPMVENCFKHCDFENNTAAFIHILLHYENGTVYFETKNSKSDANQQKDTVGGVGLENIKRRLELRYPEKHELKINQSEIAFEVVLKITL